MNELQLKVGKRSSKYAKKYDVSIESQVALWRPLIVQLTQSVEDLQLVIERKHTYVHLSKYIFLLSFVWFRMSSASDLFLVFNLFPDISMTVPHVTACLVLNVYLIPNIANQTNQQMSFSRSQRLYDWQLIYKY